MESKNVIEYFKRKLERNLSIHEEEMIIVAFNLGEQSQYDKLISKEQLSKPLPFEYKKYPKTTWEYTGTEFEPFDLEKLKFT